MGGYAWSPGGKKMERKKLRDTLLLGSALLGIWFVLNHADSVVGFVQMVWAILTFAKLPTIGTAVLYLIIYVTNLVRK